MGDELRVHPEGGTREEVTESWRTGKGQGQEEDRRQEEDRGKTGTRHHREDRRQQRRQIKTGDDGQDRRKTGTGDNRGQGEDRDRSLTSGPVMCIIPDTAEAMES